jgi:DNA-binding transcriptional MerR regulator
MGEYSIKDLERLSGIMAHTIRIWEKRYGIIEPDRTGTNRRIYSDDELRKVINISFLNRSGFKISRIASMSVKEIEEKVSFLTHDNSCADTRTDSLIIAMLKLDELNFNDLLTNYILNHGFENTFTQVIFPFLRRVGTLWMTGAVTPAQEHFVSSLIQRKLLFNIETLTYRPKDGGKKILLFLPENELHDISLLFYTYIAKKNGHEVLYLGSMTPLDSVRSSLGTWPADIIVTGTSSNMSVARKTDYINELSGLFSDQLVLIMGTLKDEIKDKQMNNIRTANDINDYIELINAR